MRSFFRATLVALTSTVAFSGRVSAQGQKLAYVQTSLLLDQAPGRADAESLFVRESAGVRDQIKRMSDSLNAMVAAFEKKQASLAPAARDAQAKDLQAKEAGYQARARDLETKMNARQNELVQPIL